MNWPASRPDSPNQPYDIREVIADVVDDGDFLEVAGGFAPNIVVGFARLGGRSVGVVGNQPAHLAGCLDINASLKGALKTGADKAAATAVGKLVAERAKAAGVSTVVFDRGAYMYHGRVKALADAARAGGLTF